MVETCLQCSKREGTWNIWCSWLILVHCSITSVTFVLSHPPPLLYGAVKVSKAPLTFTSSSSRSQDSQALEWIWLGEMIGGVRFSNQPIYKNLVRHWRICFKHQPFNNNNEHEGCKCWWMNQKVCTDHTQGERHRQRTRLCLYICVT